MCDFNSQSRQDAIKNDIRLRMDQKQMAKDDIEYRKPIHVTDDYIFKGIFNDKERIKNFLENIIVGKNKILDEDTIFESIEYLNVENTQIKIREDSKKTIFDCYIKTNKGSIIVEMQKEKNTNFVKRAEFYASTAYSNQIIKRNRDELNNYNSMEDYKNALPVIVLGIFKPKLFIKEYENIPCISYHTTRESTTNLLTHNSISYIYVELAKLDKYINDKNLINDDTKDWLIFLKTNDLQRDYKNKQVISAVEQIINIRKNNYEEYLYAEYNQYLIENEKKTIREESKKEGREEGREENRKETARIMKLEKAPTKFIIKCTGLTKEEIDKIN